MTAFQAITTDKAPTPKVSYSQGVLVDGLLFTAGFGPHDPVSGEIRGSSIAEQTEQALTNVAAVLRAADLTLADVVKVTVHLQNLEHDFPDFQTVYERHFTSPLPVRTTVGSTLPGFLVEIDVIAVTSV